NPERPALAIEGTSGQLLSWAGPVYDRYLPRGDPPGQTRVLIVAGSVSTALAARAPLRFAGVRPTGTVTAELTLQARRHIRNAYLSDFDRLSENEPGIEVRYLEPGAARTSPAELPARPPDPQAREGTWNAPDRTPLATVRVLAPPPED